jgi:hypothetical protein
MNILQLKLLKLVKKLLRDDLQKLMVQLLMVMFIQTVGLEF